MAMNPHGYLLLTPQGHGWGLRAPRVRPTTLAQLVNERNWLREFLEHDWHDPAEKAMDVDNNAAVGVSSFAGRRIDMTFFLSLETSAAHYHRSWCVTASQIYAHTHRCAR